MLSEFKLLAQQYKVRFLLSCVLVFVQSFFFSSLYYQFPLTLRSRFDFSQRRISAYMLGLSACSFVSTLLVGPLFDILGRRKMLLLTCTRDGT
jgi:MFS family permease